MPDPRRDGEPKHGSRGRGKRDHQASKLDHVDREIAPGSDNEDSPSSRKKVRWERDDESEETEGTVELADTEATESTIPEKIGLAAWCRNCRVGVAYYDPIRCMIYVLEDTEETAQHDLTRMILEQVNPDIVFTSSRADDAFMDTVRDFMETSNGIFQVRPHKEFSPAKGRERLLSLPLLSDLPQECSTRASSSDDVPSEVTRNAYEFMSRRRQSIKDPTAKRWNALIRLSNFASVEASPLCIASVGALLDHLVRQRAVDDLDDEGIHGLEVRGIEFLALNEVMQINADALFSLQVFESESHASVHSDKLKEGLSLAGMLNTTNTSLGRALMRTWLLRPSLSLAVINARHDAVACFLLPENLNTINAMHSYLKGIKNVPRMLGILRIGKAKVAEWQGLVKFTVLCAMLKEALAELHEARNVEIVNKVITALDIATFRDIGTKINDVIDWEESAQARRVCVRPHIDEELDNRKYVYHGIDSVLSKVAERICQTVPRDYAPSLNVVYFPQLGFLICVPMQVQWRSEAGVQVMDGWSFQFSSESHVYFKSQDMHDMDAHIGDLHSLIVDREIEIVQSLLEEVLVHDQAMSEACDACAELDCLFVFADASRAYGYHRPVMVDDNIIDIIQGRHPLQEMVVDAFVPNDAHLIGGHGFGLVSDSDCSLEDGETRHWNSVLLCTGANACGKSVYLKQIALIQYMAQIGCFVPAESATLGIVDKIFTRISTRESVSKVQSAFMIDLGQVSLALRNCTSRSLLLLDEFGKGTLSTDGAGLLCGVVKHLLNRGPNCPKVLVATHFHDVFGEGILDPESLPISFLHMQIMFITNDRMLLDCTSPNTAANGTPTSSTSTRPTRPILNEESVRHREEITYLYRATEGLSLDSQAAKCAETFGIPSRIVQRAQYVSQLLSAHETGRLLDEEMSESETMELQEAESVCRRFLAWDFEQDREDVKRRLAKVLGKPYD